MKQKYLSKSHLQLGGLILVMALAGLLYQFLVYQKLEQSSALFIGLATVLTLGLSLFSLGLSATSTILWGTVIGLILSMILLGEGMVCILMASPLFLMVAVIIGQMVDRARNKGRMRIILAVLLIPLSLEGVTEELSFNRFESVTITQTVALTPEQLQSRLGHLPDLSRTLPFFLKLGFPRPQNFRGEDLSIGAVRCIFFAGGEGAPGDMCWRVAERSDTHILFQLDKDESRIAHWMTWRDARVEWFPEGDRHFRVVVTATFWRELDPAWYFSPLERYGVQLALKHITHAFFANKGGDA